MSNKVKVPGGAFYAGDGLTVDPINRTVSAGGSGSQADWNQNDSTALDYVKNRPFYTGDPVETVFVEESTVSFVWQDGMYEAAILSTFEATVGETYKVYWDGTAYECTCVSFDDTPTIGNLSIIGAGSDTGEPFLMLVYIGEGILIIAADTSSSHTFSISRTVVPVVKIDKKYLAQSDWNQNDETAIDYVKNRTHYTYMTKEKEVLNSGEVSVTGEYYDSSQFMGEIGTFPDFQVDVDAMYRIEIADKVFNSYPDSSTEFRFEDETGDHWGLITYGNNVWSIFGPNKGVTTIPFTTTVKVTCHPKKVVVPIDEKFIPEQFARKVDLPLKIVTTYGTGSNYKATVDGITSLYNGLMLIIIPHVGSTTTAPTLNVNNLGDFTLKRYGGYKIDSITDLSTTDALSPGYPAILVYVQRMWVVLNVRL